MYCHFRGIGAMVLLASAVWAQNPSDVSFRLATKDGKTTFHVGEAVEVEFQFQSTAPGRYAVWTPRPVRQARQPEYDKFFIAPSAGVADPLADIFAQISGLYVISGRIPAPTPLAAEPVKIGLQINEWLSIRQPGHYRVTAETTRVVTTTEPAEPVPLRSNTVEIDVVPATPEWAAEQLKQAVTTLKIPTPPEPKVGVPFDPRVREAYDEDASRAARVLRFLGTPEAALALARFYDHGPPSAQAELNSGLFASPERSRLIAAMEEQVAAPDVPITYSYLGALMALVNLTRYGPTPTYTAKTREESQRWILEVEAPYHERSKSTEPEYFGKLVDALGHKQGEALAISLATLMTYGPQPVPPTVAEALRKNFKSLPESSQSTMLSNGWPRMGSPAIEPLVRDLAEGNGPLSDMALMRLWELNPDVAREITLSRVRKADIRTNQYQNNSVLLSLSDETLPDADQALIDALKEGKQVAILIARYASSGARLQLEAWVEEDPDRICEGLTSYFFRVDPAWAVPALARARQGPAPCDLPPDDDAFMSPALERQALEDVDNTNPTIRRTALTLLQRGGSPAAQQPLLEAFVRSQQASTPSPSDKFMLDFGIEQGFLDALLAGSGPAATPEMVQRVTAACTTDSCRTRAASLSERLQTAIGVELDPLGSFGYAQMGGRSIYSRTQFEKHAARYPKGTAFYLIAGGVPGTWHHDHVIREATDILEAAGMKVVDRPRPPAR